MTAFEDLPSPKAGYERLADWVEYVALTSGAVSRTELVKQLDISSGDGGADAGKDDSEEDEDTPIEALADAVFHELEDRLAACGGENGAFPYTLTGSYLEKRATAAAGPYAFMVALAARSKENGNVFRRGVKIFEQLSAAAAQCYIGSSLLESKALVFGFPRRDPVPKGFADALQHLCVSVGEGVGPRKDREKLKDEKDGGLDVVAWTSFLDGRGGKLIALGQCAAGKNWDAKTTALASPQDWWTNWLSDRPGAMPIKMFFVPHRVTRADWINVCAHAGILFDRCRIAHLTSTIPADLVD